MNNKQKNLLDKFKQRNRQSGQPQMAWLQVNGYMQAWLQMEFGGRHIYYGKQMLSLFHIKVLKRILREETVDDLLMNNKDVISLSPLRMDCLQAGMKLNAETMRERFGVERGQLTQYLPIECPHQALTQEGVLRPWTRHVSFSRPQARSLQRVLGALFWNAVADFNKTYAENHKEGYPAVDMVAAFCDETDTSEVYIQEIRREWQRKEKGKKKRGMKNTLTD